MNPFPSLALALPWLAAAGLAGQQPLPGVQDRRAGPTASPSNVVLVVLDDVGTEKLSFYGKNATYPPTPSLARLAEAGVLFTHAYAQPLCSPARACIQTGRYAFRTGMGDLPYGSYALPDSEVTLAEMVTSRPVGDDTHYATAMFGKWHLCPRSLRTHPVDNGYGLFEGTMGNVPSHFGWTEVTANRAGASSRTVGGRSGPFDESTFTASETRRDALRWINAQTGPFFACVCFNPPHAPFQVPPLSLVSEATRARIGARGFKPGDDLTDTQDDTAAYEWMIEAADTEVGRLVDGIGPVLMRDTLIVIIGDNGTPVSVVEPPFEPSHAKGSVYDFGTRVPLLVVGAGVERPGSVCSGLVDAVDLWATLADVTGAAIDNRVQRDSVSFLHMIRNPSAASHRGRSFVQRFLPDVTFGPEGPDPSLDFHLRGMTDGHFRYLRLDCKCWPDWEEVYDLRRDPLEKNDLFSLYTNGLLPPEDTREIGDLIRRTTALSGR